MPGKPPLVTVVLATCRASPFLGRALESLKAQTTTDWELVVVDDGSPDPEWLASALAGVERARLIRQDRLGVASARNIGCAVAEGELVAFLDDDDYWPNRRLELGVAALGDGAAASYGRLAYVDATGAPRGEGPDCSSEQARLAAGFHMGTLLVRCSAGIRAGWFDPLLEAGEDLDFGMRLAQVGELVYVPELLLYYRRHPDNTTNRVGHTRAFAREVYEHHYRLALLRGDEATALAIAAQTRANERYFALEAGRSAKQRLARGELGLAAADLRAALESVRSGVRAGRRERGRHRRRRT